MLKMVLDNKGGRIIRAVVLAGGLLLLALGLVISSYSQRTALFIMGGVLSLASGLSLVTLKKYRIELQKGVIAETSGDQKETIDFEDISNLDCKWKVQSSSITPNFVYFSELTLIKNGGSKIVLSLKHSGFLVELDKWIKNNYPKAQIGHEAEYVLKKLESGNSLRILGPSPEAYMKLMHKT